jgi:hypothetical protein
MHVYVVEYCDAVVGIYTTKKKAQDYVASEFKRYTADKGYIEKSKLNEWLRNHKKDYEIYKVEVE